MSEDALADAVGVRLLAWPRQRISVDDLVEIVLAERPELTASTDLGPRLLEVVDELTTSGVVVASKGTTRFRGVGLPSSLRRQAAPRSVRERPALRHPWNGELAWAAATEGIRFERMRALDAWLSANPDPPRAPVKERSLEVWGDEKLLDHLLRGLLNGRATEFLRVDVVHPPLVVEQIGDSSEGLIVENATTWRSLVDVGREHVGFGATTSLGWIAYGAGNQVGAAVPGLAGRAPSALWYFGDLDDRGLRFATDATRAAAAAGLPSVQAHHWLYDALLRAGRPQARGTRSWSWSAAALAWLGPDLGERVASLANTWLAQEWVGAKLLRTDPAWLLPRGGRSPAGVLGEPTDRPHML